MKYIDHYRSVYPARFRVSPHVFIHTHNTHIIKSLHDLRFFFSTGEAVLSCPDRFSVGRLAHRGTLFREQRTAVSWKPP